jgi:fructose-1,6-bisphosphatase/inositol monophosphatase family enzyme
VARQAGDTIRKAFHAPKRVEEKSSIQDLVTETDRSVELLIKKLIGQHYPTHHFIGEETHVCDGVPEGPTWIVDPIDGTTNFVHGYHNRSLC